MRQLELVEPYKRSCSARAELILTARSKDQLDALAQQIHGKAGKADVFVEDLAQQGSGERLHEQTLAAGLDVDLLINNAG